MAPRIPASALPAPVPQFTAPSAARERPDYVVQPNDTLWRIAKHLVEGRTGQPASNAQVARALTALQERNQHLCTPERGGGDLIRPGDPVFFPEAQPAAGWGAAPSETKPIAPPPTRADEQAAVSAQNSANAAAHQQATQQGLQVMQQVANTVDAQLAAGKPLSAVDVEALSTLLGRFAPMPEVVNGAAASHLRQVVDAAKASSNAPAPTLPSPATQTSVNAQNSPAVQQVAPTTPTTSPDTLANQDEVDRQRLAPRLASAVAKIKALGTGPLPSEDAAVINQALRDSSASPQLILSEDYQSLTRAVAAWERDPTAPAVAAMATTPAMREEAERKRLTPLLAHAAASVKALGKADPAEKELEEIRKVLLDAAMNETLPQTADFKYLTNRLDKFFAEKKQQAAPSPQPAAD